MKNIFSAVIFFPFIVLGCKTMPTQLRPTSVPTQGLLAYYPFNGDANDASGKNNNGTVHGASLTSDRFGRSNGAYYFTGGAYISIPELFPDTVSAFTFTVWVMKDSADGNSHMILDKGLDQGQSLMAITKLPSGTVAGFAVNLSNGYLGGQNYYYVNSPDTLKAKTYYFLVGRYSRGQKVDFSINGILIGSSVVPDDSLARWPGHDYSAIGAFVNEFPPVNYWNGALDDLRVYNRALNDDEVLALYHEGGWAAK